MTSPIASIVIPAHNEGRVIDRCLQQLLGGATTGEFEVVVVCNACTDDTARRAATHLGVRVVAIPVASKTAALDAGDDAVSAWPRIYLDADVQLTSEDARALARSIVERSLEAAAPRIRFDTSGSSWAVQRHFALLEQLPVYGEGYVGSGVFALSAAGRARFAAWPSELPDDAFVKRSIPPERRGTTPGWFVVTTPATLRPQVKRSIRIQRLHRRLAEQPTAELRTASTGSSMRYLLARAREPRWWPNLAVLTFVTLVSRIGAALQDRRGVPATWLRDESTR